MQEQSISNTKEPVLSVGEEFVSWAEIHWKLEHFYTDSVKDPAEKGGELLPYSLVRSNFINHINEIIKQRLRYFGNQ